MPLSWIRIAVAAGVTIAALVIALSYWTYIHYSDNPNMLSGVGQLIGSTATTITFVSLVISQSIQVHQLFEQKNALRLQADSLDLQARTAVEAASVSAAQIYLQVSGDARRTLGYHARSLLKLFKLTPAYDSRFISESIISGHDSDQIVEAVVETKSVNEFIENRATQPIVSDICMRYCIMFENISAFASTSKVGLQLFAAGMQNSPYEHLYVLIKAAMDQEKTSS